MAKPTTTKVHQNQAGQYQVTIPKALGDALDLDGAELTWRVEGDELHARAVAGNGEQTENQE